MNSRPLPYQGSALPLSYNGWSSPGTSANRCSPKGNRHPPDTSRSGRRGSNPRPTAWKAVALPTELLPHNPLRLCRHYRSKKELFNTCLCFRPAVPVGKDGFEPPNSEEDRFTVCCRWPLGYLPKNPGKPAPRHRGNPRPHRAREGTRTPDQLITNQLLYQLSYSGW